MSSKILSHRAALCNMVRRHAVEAGELILEYADGIKDMGVTYKEDGSPVTVADKEAEILIKNRLSNILPDILFVGEESFADCNNIDFSEHDYFWLVDPLDGTRAFVAGEADFTVNIALIHKYEPVLGVIYAPESGETYAGYIEDDGSKKAVRNLEDSESDKDIRSRKMPKVGLTVMLGSHHGNAEGQEKLLDQFKVKKIVRRSSSIKICTIASGKADLYPRFGPTCEWDTAAGHAILRAAGGDIVDMKGQPLKYGGSNPELLNPDFIAASGDIIDSGVFDVE